MQLTYSLAAQLIVATAAVGLLAGCPNKVEDETATDASTGTTSPSSATDTTTSEDTTEGTTTEVTTTGVTTTGVTTTGTTTTGATDTSTGEPAGACECIDSSNFGLDSFTCPGGPCGLLAADCLGGGGEDTDDGGECVLSVDEATLACALDLLIAGDAGVVKWTFTADQGFSESGGFVQVLANREGLTRTWQWLDLGGEDSAAGVVPLQPAAYFQGCKDMADPGAKFWCLTHWSEQEPAAQCDEAGVGSDI